MHYSAGKIAMTGAAVGTLVGTKFHNATECEVVLFGTLCGMLSGAGQLLSETPPLPVQPSPGMFLRSGYPYRHHTWFF